MSSEADATYNNFRIWLDDSSPTEEMWDAIITEDENFYYSTPHVVQNETTPPIESEINVYTSRGAHDGNDPCVSGVEKVDT